MADGLTFKVAGLDQVQRALEEFAGDLRKTVRGALRSASRPLVTHARSVAPVLKAPTRRRVPGTIRRNIKVFNSKKATGRDGVIGVYVSVKASRKDLKRAPVSGDPYYWRWLEGGHKIVPRSRRTGTRFGKAKYETTIRARRAAATGFVAPRSFLQPAFAVKGGETVQRFTNDVLARVAKFNGAK